MTGMSRETGYRILTEQGHIAQSVEDILTTPINTRVMRREYGSKIPNLIDAPLNSETVVDLYMAVAEALDRWEPRLVLRRVQLTDATSGNGRFLIEGDDGDGAVLLRAGVL